jgi:hypothetical protein
LNNILLLNREKDLSQFTKNYLLPQKLSLSSQKSGFGIRDLGKTYSGSATLLFALKPSETQNKRIEMKPTGFTT